jgi:hypothetical protein
MAVLLTLIVIVALALVTCLALLGLLRLGRWPFRAQADGLPPTGQGGSSLADRSAGSGRVSAADIHRYQLSSLPGAEYTTFGGFRLPALGGRGTVPVEHVVVSARGVFVVVTRTWGGTVSGGEDRRWWRQRARLWSRRRANPLVDGRRQARVVARFLSLPVAVVHPVICLPNRSLVFDGAMPPSVVRSVDLARHLRSFGKPVLERPDLDRVCRLLADHVAASDREVDRAVDGRSGRFGR